MEVNINSPVYYKDHYGIDNAVYASIIETCASKYQCRDVIEMYI